jgi:hypothetical protein
LLHLRNIPASAMLTDLLCKGVCLVLSADSSNPDKAITQPYLGREAVRFCSILHDELTSRAAAAG